MTFVSAVFNNMLNARLTQDMALAEPNKNWLALLYLFCGVGLNLVF